MSSFNKKLLSIALAVPVSFNAWAEMGSMQGGDKQEASMMGVHCPMKLDANQFEQRILPEEVENNLLFMREEEKLARDVYQALYIKHFSFVFGNIADSEQMHMKRIKIFLDAYDLTDSASEEEGVFNNTELQTLHDDLVAQGFQSELEAYKVGAYIEEVDINDLENAIKKTNIPELKNMYMQLKKSSYMHLRKFDEQIVKLGGSYQAQVLTQDAYDAILNAKGGMMLMGNGVRATSNGVMKTNTCIISNLSADTETLQNASAIGSNQAVEISYQVDADPSDVGTMADWVVVASYSVSADDAPSWFMRNGDQWQTWNGSTAGLSSSMSNVELKATQEIPAFSGVLSGMPGMYTIQIGYRTAENGLVYGPAPLKFSINP